MPPEPVICYSDGGCHGKNAGLGEGGVLTYGSYKIGDQEVVRCEFGTGTNNTAEYQALIECVKALVHQGVEVATIKTDSMLVARQVDGTYSCNQGHLRPLLHELRALLEGRQYLVFWVRRAEIVPVLGH